MTVQPKPNADWDVLYSFAGPNAAASAAGAEASQIIVHLQNTSSGQADASLQVALNQIQYPLDRWVPVCKGDGCAYREQKTNLLWAPSDGIAYDWDGANAACEALVFGGFSDWRLPTSREQEQAYADSIKNLGAPNNLNFPSGTRYWSGTLTGQDASDTWTVDWSVTQGAPMLPLPNTTTTPHALCVR
jgi:hypothetical protein